MSGQYENPNYVNDNVDENALLINGYDGAMESSMAIMGVTSDMVTGDSSAYLSKTSEVLCQLTNCLDSLTTNMQLLEGLASLPKPLSAEHGDLFYKTVASYNANYLQVKSLIKLAKLS